MEEQYLEMILLTKEWYENKTSQLQQMVELGKELKIKFEGNGGNQVDLPEQHKEGFLIGIKTALEVIGKFPIQITEE
jgi:hypothetical protein